LLLLLLPFSFAPHTRAQSGAAAVERVSQFVIPLHGEGFIAFKVEAAPTAAASAPKISANLGAIQAALTPQVLLADNHVVHRVLVDAGGNFVFGYDLIVEPVAASKQFKVSIKPLSTEFEKQLRSRQQPQQPTGATVAASRAPQPNVSTLPHPIDAQLIDDGDAFALDLLVNSETGVKIMDVVKVSFDRAKLWRAPQQRSMPLRDFTLGNVELAVREHKLTINGELVGGGEKPARGCAGALLWFYVPNRGRFIVSLMPHEGYDFQKIGRIENHKISFTLGGDIYEWTSSASVVGRSNSSGGNWNLWVLHDPGYVSDFASQEQIVGGRSSTQPSSGWVQETLERALRQQRQAEFETRGASGKRNAARPRVLVGGADRIENLLPKQ
jgi:hypothetical protein